MLAVVKVESWTPRNENIVSTIRYVCTLCPGKFWKVKTLANHYTDEANGIENFDKSAGRPLVISCIICFAVYVHITRKNWLIMYHLLNSSKFSHSKIFPHTLYRIDKFVIVLGFMFCTFLIWEYSLILFIL